MNAAFHYKEEIETSIREENNKGLTFKAMSCLIFSAFSLEANVNFIAYKIFDNWDDHERESLEEKLKLICDEIGVDFNKEKRPFQTVTLLVRFRNSLAHGKPDSVSVEKEFIGDLNKVEEFKYPLASWEEYCTSENAINAFKDVNIIWHEMLIKAGIKVMETLSGGSSVASWKEAVTVERLATKT